MNYKGRSLYYNRVEGFLRMILAAIVYELRLTTGYSPGEKVSLEVTWVRCQSQTTMATFPVERDWKDPKSFHLKYYEQTE